MITEGLVVVYRQPRLADPASFHLLQDVALQVETSERLALELRGEWRHASRALDPGVERDDLAFTTALTLSMP